MNTGLVLQDFDTLITLNQKNTVAYTMYRRNFLREGVLDAPKQYRLMLDDVVWRMDAVREAAPSQLQTAVPAMSMIMGSLSQMRARVAALQSADITWRTQVLVLNLQ